MPELPDVEVYRQYFNATALHQEVDSVEVNSEEVLKEITPQSLGRKLNGRAFSETERHGKYLFARLEDTESWLLLHFGMTGDLEYAKSSNSPPEYELVGINFEDGARLSYIMVRKLGEVRVIDSISEFIKQRGFGPDVLKEDFSLEKFKDLLNGRRGMIKSTLMNQEIMAGIGNVYSDEILYQAGIHPKTKVNQLSESDLKKIYSKMHSVLETAIEDQANPQDYPDSYITPLRGTDDPDCPKCSGKLEKITVSGRTGYYCPDCQQKPAG